MSHAKHALALCLMKIEDHAVLLGKLKSVSPSEAWTRRSLANQGDIVFSMKKRILTLELEMDGNVRYCSQWVFPEEGFSCISMCWEDEIGSIAAFPSP